MRMSEQQTAAIPRQRVGRVTGVVGVVGHVAGRIAEAVHILPVREVAEMVLDTADGDGRRILDGGEGMMPFAVQLPVMEVHVMVADDQMQPARVDGVQAVADMLHRRAVADIAHDPQLVHRGQRGVDRGDDGGVMCVGVGDIRHPQMPLVGGPLDVLRRRGNPLLYNGMVESGLDVGIGDEPAQRRHQRMSEVRIGREIHRHRRLLSSYSRSLPDSSRRRTAV